MALNLVDYSDSDSHSDSDQNPPKRARSTSALSISGSMTDLPPLPSRFHDLYVAAPRLAAQDDPSLHGGRQRTVPHEIGNWPTFVFLEWHLNPAEFSLLSKIIERSKVIIAQHERQRLGISSIVEDLSTPDTSSPNHQPNKRRHHTKDGKFPFKLISSLVSELGTEQPLHVSLSRPNILRTEERARFIDLLEERVCKAKIKPFKILFTGVDWVSNFDGTRWFFVVTARSTENELLALLRLTNLTFVTYHQPVLYSTSRDEIGFHVTIGWSLEAPEEELRKQLAADVGTAFKAQLSQLTMNAEEVKVKIGNVVTVLPLGQGIS